MAKGRTRGPLTPRRKPQESGLFLSTLVSEETNVDHPQLRVEFSPDTRENRNYWSNRDRERAKITPATFNEQMFRHSGWKDRRRRVIEAMERGGFPAARIERFKACGACAWVMRAVGEDKVKIKASFCHDRFCQPCMRAKAREVMGNLIEIVHGKIVRFVTLTLKHRDEDLRQQLMRLLKCFRRLRQQKGWKEKVHGGAYFVEVHRSQTDGLWHPHIHVLCEGNFLDREALSAMWLRSTGDSHRVDISLVRGEGEVSKYVSCYCTKGFADEVMENPADLHECLVGLGGLRVCGTFGRWRGRKLHDRMEDQSNWIGIAKLDDLIDAANRAENWAIALMARITRRAPEEADHPGPRPSG